MEDTRILYSVTDYCSPKVSSDIYLAGEGKRDLHIKCVDESISLLETCLNEEPNMIINKRKIGIFSEKDKGSYNGQLFFGKKKKGLLKDTFRYWIHCGKLFRARQNDDDSELGESERILIPSKKTYKNHSGCVVHEDEDGLEYVITDVFDTPNYGIVFSSYNQGGLRTLDGKKLTDSTGISGVCEVNKSLILKFLQDTYGIYF